MRESTPTRTSWITVICVLLVLIVAQAKAEFYTGNKLVETMREYEKYTAGATDFSTHAASYYMGYITGVCDATEIQHNVPVGATVGQLCEVVAKYLKANPEKWTDPAADLVIRALKKAFPK